MPTKKEVKEAILGQTLNKVKQDAIVLIPSISGAVLFAQNRVIPYAFDKESLEGLPRSPQRH
jgi:hypothetical protein